jgi:hypothetical protein
MIIPLSVVQELLILPFVCLSGIIPDARRLTHPPPSLVRLPHGSENRQPHTSHTVTHVQFFRLKLSSISGTASSFNAIPAAGFLQ